MELALFFTFLFGAVIGSFLNVVSLRYNTGLSIWTGRSKCFSCGEELKWYDLVPIFSFLYYKGRCRVCKSSISIQYPMVEVLTGVLFVGILIRQLNLWAMYSTFSHGLLYSSFFFIYYGFIWGILLVIAVYDIRHKIIPNGLVYTFIVLGILKLLLFIYCKHFNLGGLETIDYLNLLAPIALSLPFALLWLVSGGRWIGFGDAKLAFGVGALLGFVSGVSAIVLAFWIGAIWAVAWIVYYRAKKHFDTRPVSHGETNEIGFKSEVPFAPFIIAATAMVFLTRVDVLGLGSFLKYFYE